MKKYVSVLCIILALVTLLCACAPTVTPDTTVESVTDAMPDNDGTSNQVPTESPTEPETEPEVLVSAIPPKQVLKTLLDEVNVVSISSVSKQVTLRDTAMDSVQNAFLKEGYILARTTPAHETKLQTAVLKSLDHVVTLVQTTNGSLHVLWEKAAEVSTAPLYPVRGGAQGDVTMVQVGIARGSKEDNPMIGMCYVYRLADGTAVIIDGGVNNTECADNLYKTLEKLGIDKDAGGKFKITAWIFSHGHADHMGAFKKFASLYADKADLTYVMYSFPTEDVAPKGSTTGEAFAGVIREAFPNAVRISPHAGLTYFFGGLSVHVLYAPELLYTSDAGVTYYNTTSLILRLEANGQSVLHMGDASEASSEAAWAENNSAAFQSNALQITHHGLYTGPESHQWVYLRKIYQATDASIGLLPMGTRKPDDARNGRHTVLVAWATAGYQLSFVINKKDNRGGATTDQAYYDKFVSDVAAGTANRETLFGYNGINTVDNGKGLLTYLNASEVAPMATVFTLASTGMTVVTNEELAAWLD